MQRDRFCFQSLLWRIPYHALPQTKPRQKKSKRTTNAQPGILRRESYFIRDSQFPVTQPGNGEGRLTLVFAMKANPFSNWMGGGNAVAFFKGAGCAQLCCLTYGDVACQMEAVGDARSYVTESAFEGI